ncbi:unnamed protein product [Protopolystoma xenopodis]|uniref:Uncharacterized protein n=1 Tax=Protopolystoma xenopodis TaxID=117903 RepID=A0A3S5CK60_9PLAT|nr:unnamed protein product [Protopolystoma xenopodis]
MVLTIEPTDTQIANENHLVYHLLTTPRNDSLISHDYELYKEAKKSDSVTDEKKRRSTVWSKNREEKNEGLEEEEVVGVKEHKLIGESEHREERDEEFEETDEGEDEADEDEGDEDDEDDYERVSECSEPELDDEETEARMKAKYFPDALDNDFICADGEVYAEGDAGDETIDTGFGTLSLAAEGPKAKIPNIRCVRSSRPKTAATLSNQRLHPTRAAASRLLLHHPVSSEMSLLAPEPRLDALIMRGEAQSIVDSRHTMTTTSSVHFGDVSGDSRGEMIVARLRLAYHRCQMLDHPATQEAFLEATWSLLFGDISRLLGVDRQRRKLLTSIFQTIG